MTSNIEVLHGNAAVEAASDADFPGATNPRNYQITESLMDKAMTLMEDAFRGKWGAAQRLAEAFATSDFTLAAFAAIDTEMQRQYDELPSTWRGYTDVTTVNDFRPKRLLDKWRNTVGFDLVPELTEYPAEDARGHALNEIAVAKFGRRFAISWESWINNEAIQEFEDLPGVIARQARETEAINAVSNLIAADRNGVNTAFFKAGNGNAPTALPLTLDNLDGVLDLMAARKSKISGRTVAAPPLQVVVPQTLKRTIERILAVRTIKKTTTSGSDSTEFEYDNYVNVDYVVDPMLDYWNTGSKAAGTWFVVPKPKTARPALWAAYLRGHEQPDIRVKSSASQRVGGGDVSPLEGSFEIDDIQYRGRHIVGHQNGDPTFTYASNGS
ncbi:hypothetical protein GUY44_07120 [Pimelobacter simplex]|uniref:Uncharacterized protein n=1 Tax=Nocardioides simplex TaxID=2045 RepID=A0A0A1DK98_NOCSI|nr:hypothetical protein [Pimelobacter simplex]AIY17779.1 hypothetical protein KR76_15225 [Pimelobacter simplex]MCG8150243.1 hypothetical protein [Pimelobacter simplex]UUW88462.1 hypothetical protein M0M43_22345 [Pimelobacter simplex]UUW97966.1 hypothetical protein M0M48_10990 [Pimelobacter simplex]SFM71872.1 hypothetical protein SAMN05421671_3124 [Pimelobacter simplex]